MSLRGPQAFLSLELKGRQLGQRRLQLEGVKSARCPDFTGGPGRWSR